MSNSGNKIPTHFTLKFRVIDGELESVVKIFDNDDTTIEDVPKSKVSSSDYLKASFDFIVPQLIFINKPDNSVCCIIFNNIPYCWC